MEGQASMNEYNEHYSKESIVIAFVRKDPTLFWNFGLNLMGKIVQTLKEIQYFTKEFGHYLPKK